MSASADPCASPPPGTLSCYVTTATAVAAAITFSATGAAPTPLYYEYQQHFGLTPFIITMIFAAYVLCLCLVPRPRPNRRSLAYLTVSSMLPPLLPQRGLQRVSHFGAVAWLQHLLPTLQEWCCHHPCKARFRLAGSPLPGGS